MDSKYLKMCLEFGVRISKEAGKLVMEYYNDLPEVETKSDYSPVTIADREAEMLIRNQIESDFPEHSILGEEFPNKETDSEYRWIIDPIDGTKSFIKSVPLFAVMLALEYQNVPQLGIIHVPPLKETVYAGIGMGCKINGKQCRVSNTHSLSEAWLNVTDCADLYRRYPEFTTKLLAEVYSVRTWGDAYGYVLVATGRTDIMLDPIMSVWDIASLMPIITEAGGVFTDFKGIRNPKGESAIACNQEVHKKLMQLF